MTTGRDRPAVGGLSPSVAERTAAWASLGAIPRGADRAYEDPEREAQGFITLCCYPEVVDTQ